MDSSLFGSGVPKFKIGSTEVDIESSFVESIELSSRVLTHESIINATRNWVNVSDYDHIVVTVFVRIHKYEVLAMTKFKNNIYAYNKSEVTEFYPSQTADPFKDASGTAVKFFMEISELFPLETPYYLDTARITFTSKKPVDLRRLGVSATSETEYAIVDKDDNFLVDKDENAVAGKAGGEISSPGAVE